MRTNQRNRGMASVYVVLVITCMVLFVGLAIDVAYILMVGQQLQNAADSAAMAGAQYLRIDTSLVRDAASTAALRNAAAGAPVTLAFNSENSASGDIVLGVYDETTRIFAPRSDRFNACKVVARRTGQSSNGAITPPFAQVFGVDSVNIQRDAIAVIGGMIGAGLIVLSDHERDSLKIQGSATLIVDGGAAQVNSDDTRSSFLFGNGRLEASLLNTAGDVSVQGSADLDAWLYTYSHKVDDPFGAIPAPTWDHLPDLGEYTATGDVTLSPGYYSGGIDINSDTTVHLEPGIYILDGAGLQVNGTANIYGEGVMLYVTGTGEVDLGGTGDLSLTAPDPSIHSFDGADIYEGITIFQDRANNNDARMIGTPQANLEGVYYYPGNHLDIGGNASKFGNQLVADTCEVFGDGTITIDYDGRNPIPGLATYLVE